MGGAAGKRGTPGLSVTELFQKRLIPFRLDPLERVHTPQFGAPCRGGEGNGQELSPALRVPAGDFPPGDRGDT